MSKASSTEQKAAARLAEQLDRLPADIRRVLMESFADAAEAIAERYDPGREQNKPLTDAERKALESVGVSADRSGTFYRPVMRTAYFRGHSPRNSAVAGTGGEDTGCFRPPAAPAPL